MNKRETGSKEMNKSEQRVEGEEQNQSAQAEVGSLMGESLQGSEGD